MPARSFQDPMPMPASPGSQAPRISGAATGVRVLLGHAQFADKNGHKPPLVWDADNVINGHIMVVGASGTGKTHTLRRLMNEMVAQNPATRFHVIDVHGDIEVDGMSRVRFSETTPYGLNPLKVNDDPDFGGVRKRTRNFIAMINRTSRGLGTKQEATLINIMEDLYHANGFLKDNPKTWSLNFDPRPARRYGKRQPTVEDLKRFADWKLKQMIMGTGATAVAKLELLNRKFRALDRANAKAMRDEEIDLTRLKDECKIVYAEYIDAIQSGRELDDLIKYNSRDVMQSVYERIVNLESSGIFKNQLPPFDAGRPVWNYDIRSLNRDEQQMFVEILLEDIFFDAKRRGERTSPDTFVVIDEAHKFVSEDEGHIMNIIAKEARKFGVGLILASQSLNHFPEDVIANTSTKLILGIDEMYHDVSARKLRIEPKKFGYIKPQISAIAAVKSKGDSTANRYIDIMLPR
mgnify:CR=1 FL=1